VPGPFSFAWCGGTIQEQVLISTTGNTHGGQILTLTATGSVETGLQQLFNLAPAVDLDGYALYGIAGAGVADDTLFIYDNSVLSGETGTINLSAAATGTYTSATYKLTKAVSFGTISATTTLDSATITLPADLDLPAGTYQVNGTFIGNTLAPPPDDEGTVADETMLVSGALIDYDGASPDVDMYIYALVDDAVVQQDVTASGSGEVPVNITGFADQDWYSITSIPMGVLADLVPGLRYNIAGNGIPVGTTFVAPDSPATATSLVLEQPATSAEIGALLTITGPRTPDVDFDPAVHNRFDEEVLSVTISQEEGGFATLDIELRNPNVGLLALGRQLWCWLSWDQAWTADGSGTPDLVPLFNGQLVGVPSLAVGEVVTLQFRARPDDYLAQKSALVDDMKALPYWDPIWVAADVSQDTVLETYSALWHVDRVTLELSASDILDGEDGIVSIDESDAFYDAFSLTVGDAPLTAVTVSGTVEWQQRGDGTVEVTQRLVNAFANAGSPYRTSFPLRHGDSGGGGLISTVNGDGLKSDWPKPGASIGGGWSLTTRNDGSGKPLCYIEDSVQNGTFRQTNYTVRFTGQQKPATSADSTVEENAVAAYTASYGQYEASFPISIYKVRMVLQWRADRRRTETVAAVVSANVQRMLTDTADADAEDVSLTSQYVGQGVDAGGEVPIGSLTKASYFQTDRGASSFENLLLQARAKMRAKSRAIEIAFAVDWRTALTITLRNSVTLSDRRIAGGRATGKVKSYKLTVADGVMLGEFVIGVPIGTGAASSGTIGEETYVETDYVADGWQVIDGGQDAVVDAELYYQSLDQFAIQDDGIDLTNLTVDTAVNACWVKDGLIEQLDVLSQYQRKQAPTDGDPISAAVKMKTTVTLDLVPVAGAEFHTSFYPAVSMLALPKGLDLSAAASRSRAI
jgi:hypothetical protein